MNLSSIRVICTFLFTVLFAWAYVPHLIVYYLCGSKGAINRDIEHFLIIKHINVKKTNCFYLVFLLHTDSYFRTVFYHRIGVVWKSIIGWYRPGDKYFLIPHSTHLGGGIWCYHPFSTILNARVIGDNFVCRNNTTIGFKNTGVGPTIGDNVNLGVGVIIIGDIRIGNNVTIGAGSVVVNDIPDNAVVVGNPARIVRYNK